MQISEGGSGIGRDWWHSTRVTEFVAEFVRIQEFSTNSELSRVRLLEFPILKILLPGIQWRIREVVHKHCFSEDSEAVAHLFVDLRHFQVDANDVQITLPLYSRAYRPVRHSP